MEKRRLGDDKEDGALQLGDGWKLGGSGSGGTGIKAGGRGVLSAGETRVTGYGSVIALPVSNANDPNREQIG